MYEVRIWSESMIESYGTSLTEDQYNYWEDKEWDLIEYLKDKESYSEEVPEEAEIEYEFEEMSDYYQEILANINYTTIEITKSVDGTDETVYDGKLSDFMKDNLIAIGNVSEVFQLNNKITNYLYQCDEVGSGCIFGIDIEGDFEPSKLSFNLTKLPLEEDLYLCGLNYNDEFKDVSEHNFQFSQKSTEIKLTKI